MLPATSTPVFMALNQPLKIEAPSCQALENFLWQLYGGKKIRLPRELLPNLRPGLEKRRWPGMDCYIADWPQIEEGILVLGIWTES